MKPLFMYAAMVVTGVAGLTGVKAAFSNSPSSQEVKQYQSATVTGNLVDQRMKAQATPVLQTKTLIKVKVNKSRVIYLDEEVTFASSNRVSNSIKEMASKSSEPIYLLIDSPGGSVLDGTLIINEMEASSAPVYTVCTQLCASMAAMIHSYGAKRYSVDRAILMFHPASGGAEGQVPNMLSQLTTLQRYTDKLVANVIARSRVSKEEYNTLVAYEMWVDAEDSYTKGLVDGIVSLDIPYFKMPGLTIDDKVGPKNKVPTFKLIAPDSELVYWEHQ
jgi:ATP-dependent Clp protease protease subunit